MTESSLTSDPEAAVDRLRRLSATGVEISVDDFGTGYSSLAYLAYLARLPVDEVKVDQSFVLRMRTDSRDAAVTRSIVDLGHHLGLRVVAEGVEDWTTCAALERMGCDAVQG